MRFIVLILILCSASCGREELREYNRLDSMRILALKASSPEVSVGQTITVTPLISDAKGNGRSLTFTAEGCVDPGIARGVQPDCTGAGSFLSLGSGAVTGLNSPNYSGAANTVSITIPTTVFDGKTVIESFYGVNYIITYRLVASDGTEVRAFKRIVVSTKSSKNKNPTLSGILANESAFTSLPSSSVTLKPNYSGSSVESYESITSDGTIGTLNETLVTSWFVSEGSLDVYRTLEREGNGYSISFRPSNSVVFIAVIRDDRGGEDYVVLEL